MAVLPHGGLGGGRSPIWDASSWFRPANGGGGKARALYQSALASFISSRSKCNSTSCHKQFSAKVGTIFEGPALGYDRRFPALVWHDRWRRMDGGDPAPTAAAWAAWAAREGMVGVAPDYGSFDRMSGLEAYHTSPLEAVADARLALRWVEDHAASNAARRSKSPPDRGRRQRRFGFGGSICALLIGPQRSPMPPKRESWIVHPRPPSRYIALQARRPQFIDQRRLRHLSRERHTNGLERFWGLLKRRLKGPSVSADRVQLDSRMPPTFLIIQRKDNGSGRRFGFAAPGHRAARV